MIANTVWKEARKGRSYPPIDEDINVDVLIIGGGITGVSTAHLLSKEGLRVALIERYELEGADTGHSTAHLTYMTDTRLSELIHTCGEENARLSWDDGKVAMEHIQSLAASFDQESIVQAVPGYLVTAMNSDVRTERTQLITEANKPGTVHATVPGLHRTAASLAAPLTKI